MYGFTTTLGLLGARGTIFVITSSHEKWVNGTVVVSAGLTKTTVR